MDTEASWLDEHHPEVYGKPGEEYARCPTCEEWSPCRVRMLADALLACYHSGLALAGGADVRRALTLVFGEDIGRLKV